jgi:hypothetical protein
MPETARGVSLWLFFFMTAVSSVNTFFQCLSGGDIVTSSPVRMTMKSSFGMVIQARIIGAIRGIFWQWYLNLNPSRKNWNVPGG